MFRTHWHRSRRSSSNRMSSEILDLIRNRDKFLSKFNRSKDQGDYGKYLHYRNQVKYNKGIAKSDYYGNVVNNNKNQPKKLWQALKILGPSSKSKTKSNHIGLKINNDLNFDKTSVAKHFNTYFLQPLPQSLPAGTGRFGVGYVKNYYDKQNVSENAFQLMSVTDDKVHKILACMSSSKATGLDNLPARFIKGGVSITLTLLHTLLICHLVWARCWLEWFLCTRKIGRLR